MSKFGPSRDLTLTGKAKEAQPLTQDHVAERFRPAIHCG
jgi:hypothetical protein